MVHPTAVARGTPIHWNTGREWSTGTNSVTTLTAAAASIVKPSTRHRCVHAASSLASSCSATDMPGSSAAGASRPETLALPAAAASPAAAAGTAPACGCSSCEASDSPIAGVPLGGLGAATLCSTAMTSAVAVPEGNLRRSTRMASRRSGTARNTPNRLSTAAHRNRLAMESSGGAPGWPSLRISSNAGMIPAKPAAKGSVEAATEVVCTTTFSSMVRRRQPHEL
mmetsp:Transcript_24166/g.91190  ORF Transcript_24166/g.91190 Transcript_24166/m.91190 type:complete len:225 (+) Transcript_24166:3020-3694(+)